MKHASTLTDRVAVDELHLPPGNYNQGTVDQIAESLRYHGQVEPILVSFGTPELPDGTIVKGNHVYLAVRQLGWDEIAIVRHNFPSAQDALHYLIANNETHRQAHSNREVLGKLLEPIVALEPDLPGRPASETQVAKFKEKSHR